MLDKVQIVTKEIRATPILLNISCKVSRSNPVSTSVSQLICIVTTTVRIEQQHEYPMRKIIISAIITILTPFLTLVSHADTQVYDLNADWSKTSNPNGQWSYYLGENLMVSTDINGGGWIWANYYIYKEAGVFGSVVVPHFANFVWTAPESGMIDISGAITAQDCAVLYPTRWVLSHNENLLSDTDIDCFNKPVLRFLFRWGPEGRKSCKTSP